MKSAQSISIEEILGRNVNELGETRSLIDDAMNYDDLSVAIVVLSHSKEPRTQNTLKTVDVVSKQIAGDGVDVFIGFQGDNVPPEMFNRTRELGVEVLQSTDSEKYIGKMKAGKTENVLCCLSLLVYEYEYNTKKTFVVFIDNDYTIFDAANVQAMYAPWVLDGQKINLFTKAGGMRLKIKSNEKFKGLVSYNKFCSMLLSDEYPRLAQILLDSIDLPTNENLRKALDTDYVKLNDALINYTEKGGRNCRKIDSYLKSISQNELAEFLANFTFILHGDQGATLEEWMNMELGSGYLLELSFLYSVYRNPESKIYNIVGLPHAHSVKSDADNLLQGVELLEFLDNLLATSNKLGNNRSLLNVSCNSVYKTLLSLKGNHDERSSARTSVNRVRSRSRVG